MYKGTVTEIRDYGIIVLLGAFTEGLVHVSELEHDPVEAENLLKRLKGKNHF